MTLLFLLTSCVSLRSAELQAMSNPDDAAAWERLGDVHWRQRNTESALSAYQAALRVDPSRTHLLRRLGQSGDGYDARATVLAHPDDDEAWGDLGDSLVDTDPEGAKEAYHRAHDIDPHDGEWTTALIRLGETELIDEMRDSSDDEILGDLADALRDIGEREQACEFYRRAAELDPGDSEWIDQARTCGFDVPDAVITDTGMHATLGALLGGRPEMVEPTDAPSLQSRVDNDVALLVRLGQAYAVADETEKAVETLWGAVLVEPTDTEALQSYLLVSKRTLLDVLEDLATRLEDNDEIHGMLADHHLALGNRDKAREHYDRALEIDDDDPEWKAKLQLLE